MHYWRSVGHPEMLYGQSHQITTLSLMLMGAVMGLIRASSVRLKCNEDNETKLYIHISGAAIDKRLQIRTLLVQK